MRFAAARALAVDQPLAGTQWVPDRQLPGVLADG
jgi:hypothetical protein